MTKSIYSTRDAFDCYVYYLALKRHFTSNYDFVKYNGKVNARVDAFENRKDKFFFFKLSKRKDYKEFILANLLKKPNAWAGSLVDSPEAEEVYADWTKRQQSLTYVFKNELDELNEDDFNSNILVEDGEYPKLLSLYNRKLVSLETLIVLDGLTNCFKYWDKSIRDTIIWPEICKLAKNYAPFMSYDRDKMKKLIVEKYK